MCSKNGGTGVSDGRRLSSDRIALVLVMGCGFAVSGLVLSIWIVLWIIGCYMRFLWLELRMSKLPSSDVAHEYKSHDGQNGSFGTLAFFAGEAVITLLISELRTGLFFYLDLSINVAAGYKYGISYFFKVTTSIIR
jgi:hypothetical protein